jgi:hypothetical protein
MSKELTEIIKEHLAGRVQKGELNNESIVNIIGLLGSYLNAKTVSDYAKFENITYNGTLQRIGTGKLKTFELFNVKFVIDNE